MLQLGSEVLGTAMAFWGAFVSCLEFVFVYAFAPWNLEALELNNDMSIADYRITCRKVRASRHLCAWCNPTRISGARRYRK